MQTNATIIHQRLIQGPERRRNSIPKAIWQRKLGSSRLNRMLDQGPNTKS